MIWGPLFLFSHGMASPRLKIDRRLRRNAFEDSQYPLSAHRARRCLPRSFQWDHQLPFDQGQQGPGRVQRPLPATIHQVAIVADAHKAVRQHMHQVATDKFTGAQVQRGIPIVAVILVAKCDAVVVQSDQPLNSGDSLLNSGRGKIPKKYNLVSSS